MKIYFAGSITGGRDDAHIYQNIIDILKGYGEVLTEHISDTSIDLLGEHMLQEEYIHNRDMAWLRDSDVVVAEVTKPSLGVGYELGNCETLGKKTLCLYRSTPGSKLSAMIRGNKKFVVKDYNDVSEIEEIIKEFFI